MTNLQLEVFSLRKAEPALQGLLRQVLALTSATCSAVRLLIVGEEAVAEVMPCNVSVSVHNHFCNYSYCCCTGG